MANLTPEQRRLAATGRISEIKPSKAPAPAATPAAAPTAPAAAAAPEPVAVAPQATEATPATPEPGTPAAPAEGSNPGENAPGSEGQEGKRFRFSSEDDKAVAQLAKSRGISLVEASRIYAGETPPASQPAAATPPAAPAAPVPDPIVQELETQITTAEQRIQALTADRDAAAEDLDHKKANKINDELADLKADVRNLRNEKKGHETAKEQAVTRTHQASVQAARDRVFTEFKVFASPDSRERLVLDAYVTRAINDPARQAEFKNPNWPETLARECAAKYGITPTSAAGPAPVAPSAPAAPRAAALPKPNPQQVTETPTGAKLLTGSDGRQPSAPRTLTPEEGKALLRSNPAARRAFMSAMHNSQPGGRR
jgi:hypothetical protein